MVFRKVVKLPLFDECLAKWWHMLWTQTTNRTVSDKSTINKVFIIIIIPERRFGKKWFSNEKCVAFDKYWGPQRTYNKTEWRNSFFILKLSSLQISGMKYHISLTVKTSIYCSTNSNTVTWSHIHTHTEKVSRVWLSLLFNLCFLLNRVQSYWRNCLSELVNRNQPSILHFL